MSVNPSTSSTVTMDKTVGNSTATDAPMPDGPAAGGDGTGDKSDKDVQGKLAAEPEEGDGREGKDDAGGTSRMEEVATEADEEVEPITRAPQVLTFFVLASNKVKSTPYQKGQFVKQV